MKSRIYLYGLLLVVVLPSVGEAAQTVPGIDVVVKVRNRCDRIAFGQGGIDEIPEDFFGAGSAPFAEVVEFVFESTRINRPVGGDPMQNPWTEPAELLSLTAMSVAPIEPVPGEFYDLVVELTGMGSLTLLETDPATNGGGLLVDSSFDISYHIDFIPTGPGGVLGLDGAVQMEFALPKSTDPVPWTHFLPSGGLPAGGSNFVLGSDGTELKGFDLQTPDGSSFFPMVMFEPTCDFNGDGFCVIEDVDALVTTIAAGTNDLTFDLNGDGLVDLGDRDVWLEQAGFLTTSSGNPILVGDSNLDGFVDGADFIVWNSNKFTPTGSWSQADWNADGMTDGQDFLDWNANKFTSSDVSSVPEPAAATLLMLGLVAICRRRRT